MKIYTVLWYSIEPINCELPSVLCVFDSFEEVRNYIFNEYMRVREEDGTKYELSDSVSSEDDITFTIRGPKHDISLGCTPSWCYRVQGHETAHPV